MNFEGFQHYTVGQPYVPGKRHWPEAFDYNFRGGLHELRMFLRMPHSQEIRSTRDNPIHFSFSTWHQGTVIIVSFAIEAGISADCPFSIHLVNEDERTLPKLDFPPGWGAPLIIFLVNAETGILEVMRVLSYGNKFTRKLHQTIMDQHQQPFPADYDDQVRRIFERYTTRELMKRHARARCRTGEVD